MPHCFLAIYNALILITIYNAKQLFQMTLLHGIDFQYLLCNINTWLFKGFLVSEEYP